MHRCLCQFGLLLLLPVAVLAQGRVNRAEPPAPAPTAEVTRLLSVAKRSPGKTQPPVTAFGRALAAAVLRRDRAGEAQVREERAKSLVVAREFEKAAEEADLAAK